MSEKENNKQKTKVKKEEKSEFISTAIHELKTPIVGIKWILKSVLDEEKGDLNVEQKKALNLAYEKNEGMIRLIEDLMLANKNEEWQTTYKITEIDLNDLITEIIYGFKNEARKQNIELFFQKNEKTLPKTKGDREKIRSVLQNLIENAIKYNKKDGQIKIEVKEDEGKALVSIKDTGKGIPEDEQDKIFTKFFRSKNSEGIDGTGLGLFLAKKIINAHDGQIWFESSPENGTIFFFTLPFAE